MKRGRALPLFLSFLLFFVLLSSVVISQSIDPRFSKGDNRITADLTFTPGLTVSLGGIAAADGDNVCIGELTIAPSAAGTYSNIRDTRVECPTFRCYPRDTTTPATATPTVNLVSSSDYTTTLSDYAACIYNDTGAPPNPLAPNIIYADYWVDTPEFIGNAATGNGIFCYGTIGAYVGGALQGTESSIDSPSAVTYTPPSTGSYSLKTTMSVDGCAMMTRTYETDGPTYDCVYTGTVSTTTDSSTVTLNIVDAPELGNTSSTINETVEPGDTVSFSITVENTGALPASINSLTLTPATFTGVNFDQSFPIIVAAGSTATITGTATAPATEGIYDVGIDVSYNSSESAVGTCDDTKSESFGIGSIKIVIKCPLLTRVTSSVVPSAVKAGGTVSFSITVNNTGEKGAVIDPTQVVVSGGGFTTTLTTPTATTTLAIGEALDFNGTATAPATFGLAGPESTTLSITIPYEATLAGTCVSSLTENIGTVDSIPPEALSIAVTVDPNVLIKLLDTSTEINATFTRAGGDPVQGSIANTNLTIYAPDGSQIMLNNIQGRLSYPTPAEARYSRPQSITGWELGTYNVTIETWDSAREERVTGSATFQIVPPGEIDIDVKADPPGIILGTRDNVTVSATITRAGNQRVQGTIRDTNLTIEKWVDPYWIGTYSDDYITLSYTNGGTVAEYGPEDIDISDHTTWNLGVYKVTIETYDRGNEEIVTGSDYFVIYDTLGCIERA